MICLLPYYCPSARTKTRLPNSSIYWFSSNKISRHCWLKQKGQWFDFQEKSVFDFFCFVRRQTNTVKKFVFQFSLPYRFQYVSPTRLSQLQIHAAFAQVQRGLAHSVISTEDEGFFLCLHMSGNVLSNFKNLTYVFMFSFQLFFGINETILLFFDLGLENCLHFAFHLFHFQLVFTSLFLDLSQNAVYRSVLLSHLPIGDFPVSLELITLASFLARKFS